MKDGGSTWTWMDKSIVMGPRTSVLWEPGSAYVKVEVRPKESERELRASESKRARRIEAVDLRT